MFLLGFSLRHLTSYLKSKYHILLPVTQVCNSKFLEYLLRKHCFELLHFQNISIKIISIKIISIKIISPLPSSASDVRHCLVSVFLSIEGRASITGIQSL